MKKYFIVISLTLLSLLSFKSVNKNKDLVKLQDNLYVSKYEVSNGDWLEYVNSFKTKTPEYKAALPDTSVWRVSLKKNEPYVQFYFRHPSYKDYPVVGISFEQAVNYCEWRTNNNTENFKFRLPTKAEWIEFSSFDISNSDKKTIKLSKKDYLEIDNKLIFGNFKYAHQELNTITASVESYFPNTIGLYNVFGNVAEMISEKGIAMGGDFETPLATFKTNDSISYDKPTCTIGFRVVAEKLTK